VRHVALHIIYIQKYLFSSFSKTIQFYHSNLQYNSNYSSTKYVMMSHNVILNLKALLKETLNVGLLSDMVLTSEFSKHYFLNLVSVATTSSNSKSKLVELLRITSSSSSSSTSVNYLLCSRPLAFSPLASLLLLTQF
jgi:hypothetical protein